MFDSLSSKLQNAFRNLRGLGKISEDNVGDALREVRLALLEADVNFKVARDFIERVKAKSIGVCSVCHPTSKGEGLGDFLEAHGGGRATACSVCHTGISTSNAAQWPHQFQWKSRS